MPGPVEKGMPLVIDVVGAHTATSRDALGSVLRFIESDHYGLFDRPHTDLTQNTLEQF